MGYSKSPLLCVEDVVEGASGFRTSSQGLVDSAEDQLVVVAIDFPDQLLKLCSKVYGHDILLFACEHLGLNQMKWNEFSVTRGTRNSGKLGLKSMKRWRPMTQCIWLSRMSVEVEWQGDLPALLVLGSYLACYHVRKKCAMPAACFNRTPCARIKCLKISYFQ